ncbi:MAG: hypothetical protein Q9208_005293 [Pyrenodesmia sp. 3 TL-2023]
MGSSESPSVAALEARHTQQARQHGYDSWEEFKQALEQREEEQRIASTKQAEERKERGEYKILPTAPTQFSIWKEPEPESVPKSRHFSERCYCEGNLKSPVLSEDGYCGLNKAEKAALENLKINEGEPSKRLPDEELYSFSSDGEDDIYPGDIDRGLKRDKLTQYLLHQRMVSKRGGRHPLASGWQPINVETLPKSYTDSSIPTYANQEREGSPEVGQTESRRSNVDGEFEVRSNEARIACKVSATGIAGPSENKKRALDAPEAQHNKDKQRKTESGAAVISLQSRSQHDPRTSSDQGMKSTQSGVVGPQTTAESSSTIPVSQRQKRIRGGPEEGPGQGPLNKRIRLISDIEKESHMNIIHDHPRRHQNQQRQHPSANLPRTFPGTFSKILKHKWLQHSSVWASFRNEALIVDYDGQRCLNMPSRQRIDVNMGGKKQVKAINIVETRMGTRMA